MDTGVLSQSNYSEAVMANFSKQMQQIVEDYRRAGELWPTSTKVIAAWAIRMGRWQMHPAAAISRCAEDIATAMRAEYFIDKKGRRVRLLHPAQTKTHDGEQLVLWDDIRTAPRAHMHLSFQQNRKGIFWDCLQLKTAVDSYNDAHQKEEQIEMVFNFENDLAEHEAAGESAA
jgi:hypothetical protein